MNNFSQVVVLVLAAGRGERFRASGGSSHKLDAPLGGRSVLDHTRAAVAQAGLTEHVVHAFENGRTMGDSIAAGVAATPKACAWMVLPADMPRVQPGTLRAVADALMVTGSRGKQAAGVNAVRPAWCGQLGHPVGFLDVHRRALLALRGQSGASSVWLSSKACVIDVDDEGCVRDIDTLADLQAMQAQMLDHPH